MADDKKSNFNIICRLCRIHIKNSGRSSINLFGEKSKKENILKRLATVLELDEIVSVDGLSENLCQKCYREFLKFEKHLEQRCLLLAFRDAYGKSVKEESSMNERKREKRCVNESPKTVKHEKKKAKSNICRPLLPKLEQLIETEENVVNDNDENSMFLNLIPASGKNCTRTEVHNNSTNTV